jgi:hypothetical protein
MEKLKSQLNEANCYAKFKESIDFKFIDDLL